jgi:hypothetical protein
MIINLPKWASKITNGMSVTVWPFIFISYYHRGNDDVLDHERVHYREQAWQSPVWIYKYLRSPKYRLEKEKAAYRETMASLIRSKQAVSFNRIANLMSTQYRGIISYIDAYKWAKETYKEEYLRLNPPPHKLVNGKVGGQPYSEDREQTLDNSER